MQLSSRPGPSSPTRTGVIEPHLLFLQSWSVPSWKGPTGISSPAAGRCYPPGRAVRAVLWPWLPSACAALTGRQQQLGLLPCSAQGWAPHGPERPQGLLLLLWGWLLQLLAPNCLCVGSPGRDVSAAPSPGHVSPSQRDRGVSSWAVATSDPALGLAKLNHLPDSAVLVSAALCHSDVTSKTWEWKKCEI